LKSELTDYAGSVRSESLTVQDLREGGKLKSIPYLRSEEQKNNAQYFRKDNRFRCDNHLNASSITKDLSDRKGAYTNKSAIAMDETDGVFVPTIPMTKE